MIKRTLTLTVVAASMTLFGGAEADARPFVRRVAPVRRVVAAAPVRRVVAPVARVAPVTRVVARTALPPYPVARRAVVGPVYGAPVYRAPVYAPTYAPVYGGARVYGGGVGVYAPGISVGVGF